MWRALWLCLLCLPAWAVTPQQVEQGSARLFEERLAELRMLHRLDRDEVVQARVARVAPALIAACGHPDIRWDIHVGGEDKDNASAMAGGHILVSPEHVRQLDLTDAELAMLLAHEMAHVYLQHNWKEVQEALRLEPERAGRPYAELEWAIDHDLSLMTKLERLNYAQEEEADREGLQLVVRAGFPAPAAARYYRKLAEASPSPHSNRAEHPSPIHRWRVARESAERMR